MDSNHQSRSGKGLAFFETTFCHQVAFVAPVKELRARTNRIKRDGCRASRAPLISSDGDLARSDGSSSDSPLEEAGFEPLVPRDTTKFSTPAHVTSA